MKTALVVDDTKNIRILLAKSLEMEGFKVYTAKDANEALAFLETIDFNIAFIDIKMPLISGTALLEEIRSRGLVFKVVIMTAFGTIKNAVKTTKLGADMYLQKPFSQATITKTLEEVFGSDYSSKPINLNSSTIIKELINNDPLSYDSYLKTSEYLASINEKPLSEAFLEFSNKLKELSEV